MTRSGDDIANKIRAGVGAAASAGGSSPDPSSGGIEVVEDTEDFEDDFEDDGVTPAGLASVGPVQRPNGQVYQPRKVGTMEDVAFLRDARDHGEHLLCYGPPGTGKTAWVESSCHVDALEDEKATAAEGFTRYVHLGFESIVCGVDTTESDFFGTHSQDSETGIYGWEHGPLTRAVLFGIPLYVDEIFLADSRVLSSTLYPLMDGRTFLSIPMNPRLGRIPVKKGFFVVAAGNPNVPGADYSEALRSRFTHQIEVTSDWSLVKSLGVPQDIITVAKNLDRLRRDGALSWSPQTRELLDYKRAKERYGRDFALSDLLGKSPFEDRPTIKRALDDKFTSVEHLSLGAPNRGRRR